MAYQTFGNEFPAISTFTGVIYELFPYDMLVAIMVRTWNLKFMNSFGKPGSVGVHPEVRRDTSD